MSVTQPRPSSEHVPTLLHGLHPLIGIAHLQLEYLGLWKGAIRQSERGETPGF